MHAQSHELHIYSHLTHVVSVSEIMESVLVKLGFSKYFYGIMCMMIMMQLN